MQLILLATGLITYLGVLTVLVWRLMSIRRGGQYRLKPELWPVIEKKLDELAFYIVVGTKEIIKRAYVALVLAGEKLIKIFKHLIIKVEKRFSKIVNQVKGRNDISSRGSVSLFLKEIKDHQENIKRELL